MSTTPAGVAPATYAPPEATGGNVPPSTVTAARAQRRSRFDWPMLAIEFVLVIAGVGLALAADAWWEGVRERREAATAIRSIRDELRANRQATLESATYHRQLLDTLFRMRAVAAAAAPGAPSPAAPTMATFSRGFIHPAAVLSTAWETARVTDAVRHMPYGDLLDVARMYESQRRYWTQSEQVGSVLYGEMLRVGTPGVAANYANLATIISTFWYRECELLRSYDSLLARLDDSAPPGTPTDAPCNLRRPARRE